MIHIKTDYKFSVNIFLRLLKNSARQLFSLSAYTTSGFFLPPRPNVGAGFLVMTRSVVLLPMDQAITGRGGGLATCLIRRLRFCTVAVSRNSSLAPLGPRNLSLVMARFRFASPNNLSIFLRLRAERL